MAVILFPFFPSFNNYDCGEGFKEGILLLFLFFFSICGDTRRGVSLEGRGSGVGEGEGEKDPCCLRVLELWGN